MSEEDMLLRMATEMQASAPREEARRRVRAFLERRAEMRGLDDELLLGLDGGEGPELLISDLRLLVDG